MHVDGLRYVQDVSGRFCFRLDRVEDSIGELIIMLCDRRYRRQAASMTVSYIHWPSREIVLTGGPDRGCGHLCGRLRRERA